MYAGPEARKALTAPLLLRQLYTEAGVRNVKRGGRTGGKHRKDERLFLFHDLPHAPAA
jgi:hypothetical protein